MPINSQFPTPEGLAADNPATLSAQIAALFPPGVAAAELRTPGDPSLLFPEEALSVARAVPKRVHEFAAGRLCARRALGALGLIEGPLRVQPDRQPEWPDSVVGSITHTGGIAAAAAARREAVAALGLDTETLEVKPELWRGICVAAEVGWLKSLPGSEQIAAATLLFSAKEAFYKCQYPLTGQFLRFADVQVSLPEWQPAAGLAAQGSFLIAPARSIALLARHPAPFEGRYRFHEQYVTTALALPSFPGPAKTGR